MWPDNLSLLDNPIVDLASVSSSGRVTDTYLLVLAAQNGGKLPTLDRRLSAAAVNGGAGALKIVG
jgi:predicted nucleic acid-binding protein